MQRGYHALTHELALAMQQLKIAQGNVQYAAQTILYARRKK